MTRSPILRLIAATTLIRLIFAVMTGLGVDESYMVTAGRVLSFGYFDHPPASWWLSWGAAHLFGSESPLVVRLPFILLFALSQWLMARITWRIAGEQAAFWAVCAFNLSPVFSVTTGTWVLPDGPLDAALLGATLCLLHAMTLDSEGPALEDRGRQPAHPVMATADPRPKARDRGLSSATYGAAAITVVDGGPAPTMTGCSGQLLEPWNAGSNQPNSRSAYAWWVGAGLCAGLALFSKYTAVLTIGGAFLFLLLGRAQRHWLRRPHPYLAGVLALAIFAPVPIWNATHGWASFAFQGDRATGLRFRPLGPLETLGGEALFVLPWLWLPVMILLVRAFRRGATSQERLLATLGAPPIVLFALIAAWSSQKILFHWAAPGYLMLFPLLGAEIARHRARRWVTGTLAASAVLIVLALAVIGAQIQFDVLGGRLATIMRQDPTIEGLDWTSIRADLTGRGLLPPGAVVAALNWRDAGKIGFALGPDTTTLCLSGDARQFRFADPPTRFAGRDVIVLALGPPDRARQLAAPWFRDTKILPGTSVRLDGRTLQSVTVLQGQGLTPAGP